MAGKESVFLKRGGYSYFLCTLHIVNLDKFQIGIKYPDRLATGIQVLMDFSEHILG